MSNFLLRRLPRTCLISVCLSAYACYNKLCISWSHLDLPSPVACGWDNITSAVQRALKSLWSATTKKKVFKKLWTQHGPSKQILEHKTVYTESGICTLFNILLRSIPKWKNNDLYRVLKYIDKILCTSMILYIINIFILIYNYIL